MGLYRVVFIGSAGGSVLKRLLTHHFVRKLTWAVVSDRECGFLAEGRRRDLKSLKLSACDGTAFSKLLNEEFAHRNDLLFLSFYTRILADEFVQRHQGRILNCHPALLPHFRGMKGFDDMIESRGLFVGCTLHSVTSQVDDGPPVMQVSLPLDRSLPRHQLRHQIFLAQVYSTLQFLRWISQDRVALDSQGHLSIHGARFSPSAFAPNLDDDVLALFLREYQIPLLAE